MDMGGRGWTWVDVGGRGWTWVDMGGGKKNRWVDIVGGKNFFLWVDMGGRSRWALVDLQTKNTYIHPRPTTFTHCGWTWVDLDGRGWTFVKRNFWLEVRIFFCGWTWVNIVGGHWWTCKQKLPTSTDVQPHLPTVDGHGWTWVDMGGLGWTWVDLDRRVRTWVDVVGLGWT